MNMKFFTTAVIMLLLVALLEGKKKNRPRKWRKGESKIIDFDDAAEAAKEMKKEENMEGMKARMVEQCSSDKPAEIITRTQKGIKNQYIVPLCNKDEDNAFQKKFSKRIISEKSIMGNMSIFNVKATFRQIKKIAKFHSVMQVEQDSMMEVQDTKDLCSIQKTVEPDMRYLRRTNYRNGVSSSKYYYYTKDQEKMYAYIIDTGVQYNIEEYCDRLLEGAVCNIRGCYPRDQWPEMDALSDIHGHGTLVASVMGSATYGVTKEIYIVSVAVVDINNERKLGLFYISTVVNALLFVIDDVKRRKRGKNALLNLSVTSATRSVCIDRLVKLLHTENVVVVAAAGNTNSDACSGSPGGVPEILTVGSTDNSDKLASFSNHGSCVDMFATGVHVRGLNPQGGTSVMNGTSMSAPIAAGVALGYMAQEWAHGPNTASETIRKTVNRATNNIISGLPTGTVNKMAFLRCFRKP